MSLNQILILFAYLIFNALVAYSVMWSAKEIRAIVKGENK